MTHKKAITIEAFCQLFRCNQSDLPDGLQNKLASINTNYKLATKADIEHYILKILNKINSNSIQRNREENLATWEKGWAENLQAFKSSLSEAHLRPKYFRPSRFFRYNKTIVIPENPNLEHDLFTVVRYFLFRKYFEDFDNIYELGCGSCQNILLLAGLFPKKSYMGLDWSSASKKICDVIAEKKDVKVCGKVFDMLEPNHNLTIEKNSLVFSIHALEQLGEKHSQLISFLRHSKPALIIHYEPIMEFYDMDNLYDNLALMYSKKRDYLSGYMTQLRRLARKGKVEILEASRPYIGGVYHEASLIVWKPL